MNRFCASVAVAAVVVSSAFVPARAAPPTVTPSPGYDARLQEQRNAPATYQPVVPGPRPVSRHRAKPVRDSGTH